MARRQSRPPPPPAARPVASRRRRGPPRRHGAACPQPAAGSGISARPLATSPSPPSRPCIRPERRHRPSLRDSVLLGWLLRRCRSWQLYTTAVPCVHLPPSPPPVLPSAWIVCALGSTHHGAYHLTRRVPDHGRLVVLARTVDVERLQERIQEPLILHPVAPGVTVGRTIGAPVDLQNWPEAT